MKHTFISHPDGLTIKPENNTPDVGCTGVLVLNKEETEQLYKLLRRNVVKNYIVAYLTDSQEYEPALFSNEALLYRITDYLLDMESYIDIRSEDIETAFEHFKTEMKKYARFEDEPEESDD